MADLLSVPDWLGGAVAGAVIASLGYVAKLGVEQWRSIHAARAARLSALAELWSLLRAGKVSFDIRKGHAKRLVNMLIQRKAVNARAKGYERIMADAFPGFPQRARKGIAAACHKLPRWRTT